MRLTASSVHSLADTIEELLHGDPRRGTQGIVEQYRWLHGLTYATRKTGEAGGRAAGAVSDSTGNVATDWRLDHNVGQVDDEGEAVAGSARPGGLKDDVVAVAVSVAEAWAALAGRVDIAPDPPEHLARFASGIVNYAQAIASAPFERSRAERVREAYHRLITADRKCHQAFAAYDPRPTPDPVRGRPLISDADLRTARAMQAKRKAAGRGWGEG